MELNEQTKVAAVTTSTANILAESGLNVVAAPESDLLSDELKEKQANGEVVNIGSAIDPSQEALVDSGAELIFITDAMPTSHNNTDVLNTISMPQSSYTDIYYDLQVFKDVFNAPNAQDLINQMAVVDQAAKLDASESVKIENVAAFQYMMGSLAIANENTFIGSLLTELGINNVYADFNDSNLAINYEQLLADDPKYIIVFASSGGEEAYNNLVAQSPEVLNELTAYKNDNIIIIDNFSGSSDLDSAKALDMLVSKLYE